MQKNGQFFAMGGIFYWHYFTLHFMTFFFVKRYEMNYYNICSICKLLSPLTCCRCKTAWSTV